MLTVEIKRAKESDSLGFELESLAADDGVTNIFLVKKVSPGSPADTGGLKQGDQIISVCSNPIEMLPHEDVLTFLKKGKKIPFVVLRPWLKTVMVQTVVINKTKDQKLGFQLAEMSDGSTRVADVVQGGCAAQAGLPRGSRLALLNGNCIDEMPHQNVLTSMSKATKISITCLMQHTSTALVSQILRQNADESIGINLETSDGAVARTLAAAIQPGGLAAQSGIQTGDQILAINGTPIDQLSHAHQLDLIKSDEKVIFAYMRPPAPAESVARFMILSRNNLQESLGFAVATMDDGSTEVTGDVTPDGPAGKAGMKRGDRILAIDNIPMDTVPHDDVVHLLLSREKVEVMVLCIVDESEA